MTNVDDRTTDGRGFSDILIERMTWEQVRDALAAGWRRVILPAGAMEQHGPHMATAVDTILGVELAVRLARRLGDTLVAPPISIGVSEGQMSHPGTLSISEATFSAVVRECCESLVRHGFNEIVLIASHGGNIRPIGALLPALRAAWPDVRFVASEDDPATVAPMLEATCRKLGLDPTRVGFHAGQGETSMMLRCRPDLVDMAKAVEGFTGDISIRWRSPVPPPMRETSPTGILGDARGSTAEIGEALLAERVAAIAARVRAPG